MRIEIQNIAEGIGSLIEIFPSKTELKLPKRKTPTQRMEATWIKTGNSLKQAMSDYELSRRK